MRWCSWLACRGGSTRGDQNTGDGGARYESGPFALISVTLSVESDGAPTRCTDLCLFTTSAVQLDT